MQSITNNIARTATIALAVFAMLAVGVALAPKAHAADLDLGGGDWVSDYYVDYTAPSYDYGGGSWVSDYYTDYTQPSYDYGYDYGSGFSGGGGFGGSGFSGMGGFGGGGGRTNIVAPSSASANTTIYSPSTVSTCTAPNSCNSSVDDRSVFNAPTTVTIAGGGNNTPVYVPVYQPQYPVYNPPVVYPNPTRQPYVSLNQVPYTGLDLGPVGTVLYWSFLVFWCLVAAYLIVYKRVQTKLVSGLNSFLFGAPAAVGTHAKVVVPAKASVNKAYVAPAAKDDDAIDPFIASQIARNK